MATLRDTTVVIPAAGLDTGSSWQAYPKAMQPVLGRPFILLAMEHLIAQGHRDFVIIENPANDSIQTLLKFVYSWNPQLSITFVKQEKLIGPLYAIALAEPHVKSKDLLIWLGDTYCSSSTAFTQSTVLVNEVQETFRWCIAEVGECGAVKGFQDKVPSQAAGARQALAGVYYLKDARGFFDAARASLSGAPAHTGYYEISQALTAYLLKDHIRAIPIEGWVDAGNQDMLLLTLGRVLSTRTFNRLEYDAETNVITKTSDPASSSKLRNEIFWMQNVPAHCRRFIPQVVASSMDTADTHLSIEFVPQPPLSSLYVFQNIPAQKWQWVVSTILKKFERFFWSQKRAVDSAPSLFFEHVFGKLQERVRDYPAHIPVDRSVTFNGVGYGPLAEALGTLRRCTETLSASIKELSIAHGDLCFSNILFDLNSGLFKVLDPRGSFGSPEPTVSGHPLYDLAKLRHSIAGAYDSLAYDMFHIDKSEGDDFKITVHGSPAAESLTAYFDGATAAMGYDPKAVALIEATLFLSMVPLHGENPQRQLALYLTGLKKTREALA